MDEGVVVELLEDVDGDSLHQIIDDWLMLILVGTVLADGGHGLIDLADVVRVENLQSQFHSVRTLLHRCAVGLPLCLLSARTGSAVVLNEDGQKELVKRCMRVWAKATGRTKDEVKRNMAAGGSVKKKTLNESLSKQKKDRLSI